MKAIIIHAILSCVVMTLDAQSNKSIEGDKIDCIHLLDSVAGIMQHERFGFYTLKLEKIDISMYKNLDETALTSKNLPTDEDEQRLYNFRLLLIDLKNCSEHYTEDLLLQIIGPPFSIGKKSIIYLYDNLDRHLCPDCTVPIKFLFDNCGSIRFDKIK